MLAKALFVSVLGLSSFAMASSWELDDATLHSCGGAIELRESANGDLHLDISSEQCKTVVVQLRNGHDKEYKLQGEQGSYHGNYTLSKQMIAEMRSGFYVVVRSNSGAHSDTVRVSSGYQQPSYPTYPTYPQQPPVIVVDPGTGGY